jgi:glycosyltransferase involved in cell wall biosynthesis
VSSPLVTVTIPTYNRARLLRRALSSVLEQSLTDIEVFVSDNASDDDTASVVESFADRRVHYIQNNRNRGHFANLSAGLHLGTAPYLAILPDDDFMLPLHLERKAQFLDGHGEVGLVHSAFRRVTMAPSGAVTESDEFPGGPETWISDRDAVIRRLLSESYYISYATALIRRPIVADTERFADEDGSADDVGLSLRLTRCAGTVAYLAEPSVGITFHEEAQNTSVGGQVFVDGSYVTSLPSLANEWQVKRRFLDRFGPDLADPDELRTVLDERMRGSVLSIVKHRAGVSRPPRTVCRLFREAWAVDRRSVLQPPALRFLASSLVGSSGRRLLARPGRGAVPS